MIAALTRPASIVALLFAVEATAGAAESVTDLLRRQTQEMLDAITTGSAAVWNRYLHPEVRFTDENGRLAKKKQMVEDIKPLPEGISGQIAVTEFEVARNGNVAVATHVDDEHEEFHGQQRLAAPRAAANQRGPPPWQPAAGNFVETLDARRTLGQTSRRGGGFGTVCFHSRASASRTVMRFINSNLGYRW